MSVAEAIDAATVLAAVGVERTLLRDALAATLVKREEDRALYDDAFDRLFPARVTPARAPQRRRQSRPAAAAESGAFGGGGGGAGVPGGSARPDDTDRTATPTSRRSPARQGKIDSTKIAGKPCESDAVPETSHPPRRGAPASSRGETAGAKAEATPASKAEAKRDTVGTEDADARARAERLDRRARMRALLGMAFRAMSPRDVDDAAALVRALARRFRGRLSRRLRRRSRGRLDFRRTIRSSIARGGVPLERRFRARRPRKLSLVVLCDLSASTATATDFFLALLAPAADHFARVRLFGFVDRLVEIEFVSGQVRPAAPIDLMARSDFGRVLQDLAAGPVELTADTLLLVLGDARNNRRPPRADLLAAARARVRRLIWLDPEPVERWNTGDSVIATYARHADDVVSCGSLAELDRAIATIGRA